MCSEQARRGGTTPDDRSEEAHKNVLLEKNENKRTLYGAVVPVPKISIMWVLVNNQ